MQGFSRTYEREKYGYSVQVILKGSIHGRAIEPTQINEIEIKFSNEFRKELFLKAAEKRLFVKGGTGTYYRGNNGFIKGKTEGESDLFQDWVGCELYVHERSVTISRVDSVDP